jgi:hypothetical protein
MDELFTNLTRIIAHPHTAITDHDRIRAARVMLAVNEYEENVELLEYALQMLDLLTCYSTPVSS